MKSMTLFSQTPHPEKKEKHKYFLGYSVSFFLLSGLLLPSNPAWALPFYVLVVPLFILVIARSRADLPYPQILIFFLLTIGWFGLSIFWGESPDTRRMYKYLNATFSNSIYLIVSFWLFSGVLLPRFCMASFARLFTAACFVNVLISFLFYDWSTWERLSGYAETRHPILGGYIVSLAIPMALLVFDRGMQRYDRLFSVLALLSSVAFVFLTGSRGAWLTCTAALCGYVIVRTRSVRILVILGFCALAIGFAVQLGGLHSDFISENVGRESYRLLIWKDTLTHILERPFLGHGVQSNPILAEHFSFPHSLYVSALYYGGVFGLLALLGSFLCGARAVCHIKGISEKAFSLSLLAIPFVGGLTDMGQLIKPPSEEWYIVWLPLIIVCSLCFKNHQRTNPSGDTGRSHS